MAPPWPQFSPAAWPLNFFQLYQKTKMLLDKTEWNSAKVMVNNSATWGQCKQTILKNWTVGKFIHQTWSLLSDPVLFFKNTFLSLSIDPCKMHKRRQKVKKLNTKTYIYVYGTGRIHKFSDFSTYHLTEHFLLYLFFLHFLQNTILWLCNKSHSIYYLSSMFWVPLFSDILLNKSV